MSEYRYIKDRDFVPEKIRTVSTACEGLCCWVRAMDVYDKGESFLLGKELSVSNFLFCFNAKVSKIVAPKKAALAAAEAELSEQMEKLNAKRAELQVIFDSLQALNDFFAEKARQKKNLEDEIDLCEKKLER